MTQDILYNKTITQINTYYLNIMKTDVGIIHYNIEGIEKIIPQKWMPS